jgi:hypothetical protein
MTQMYMVEVVNQAGTTFTGWTLADNAEQALEIAKEPRGPMCDGWPDFSDSKFVSMTIRPLRPDE